MFDHSVLAAGEIITKIIGTCGCITLHRRHDASGNIVHMDTAKDLARNIDAMGFSICNPVKRAAAWAIDAG